MIFSLFRRQLLSSHGDFIFAILYFSESNPIQFIPRRNRVFIWPSARSAATNTNQRNQLKLDLQCNRRRPLPKQQMSAAKKKPTQTLRERDEREKDEKVVCLCVCVCYWTGFQFDFDSKANGTSTWNAKWTRGRKQKSNAICCYCCSIVRSVFAVYGMRRMRAKSLQIHFSYELVWLCGLELVWLHFASMQC